MGPKHELRISFPMGNFHPTYNAAVQKLLDNRPMAPVTTAAPVDPAAGSASVANDNITTGTPAISADDDSATGTSVAPDRTDNYFVTDAHFGLKERNGEALELKVRDKVTESGLEFWTKTSLRHADVDLCREEICSILREKGYAATPTSLVIGEIVPITKDVGKAKFDKVNFEITHVKTQHMRAVHKDWVSVVVEGKKAKNVITFISSAPQAEHVRAAVRIADEIGEIRPIVAGYPLFVRHLACSTNEHDLDEMEQRWQQLMSFM